MRWEELAPFAFVAGCIALLFGLAVGLDWIGTALQPAYRQPAASLGLLVVGGGLLRFAWRVCQ